MAPGLGGLFQQGRGFDKLSHRRQAQQVVEFIETTVQPCDKTEPLRLTSDLRLLTPNQTNPLNKKI